MQSSKLLIVSGPTASGKTSLAFSLAKKFRGELVSADSRQVYRGMDIVTGKERDKDIKTWLIDIVDPDEEFHVSAYYDMAIATIKDIWKRKKLPILVGGTGFYIKAILDGYSTLHIEPNHNLREEYSKLSIQELQQLLKSLAPSRWKLMNKSDRNNPRRLIRAIEVANFLIVDKTKKPQKLEMDVLWIGLRGEFAVLYERIDQRVEERWVMGALAETKKLVQQYGWNIPSMTGQGYRELKDFIEEKISYDAAMQNWKFAEHEYARKQMTWFKKDKRIVWFDIANQNTMQKVAEKVRAWYIG